ncbi:hypothetical protein AMAG_07517 [Allomyces macrogynus ATCC 38327]|uniref:C2H2-type domain-containing protein n=1 Tax=Allomyces macrogynus (strain ATCC 38327) TaxID=578462 RepID=A0A0L0SIE9_ALLM3|nr:hypothetical protein AMAG_07517 [Allomyces macrogynus ATCC 38327]|eukprot:KNE62283.1 hypothetical protein AMAG_07517 [Allomyces macrogynus ATCC 38327]
MTSMHGLLSASATAATTPADAAADALERSPSIDAPRTHTQLSRRHALPLSAAPWTEDASSGFNSYHDSTGAVAPDGAAAPPVPPAHEDPDLPARRATDGGGGGGGSGRAGAAVHHASWWGPLSPGAPRDVMVHQGMMRPGAVSSASMATTAHSGPAAIAGQNASPMMMGWATARSEMGFASPSSTSLVSMSRAVTAASQVSGTMAPADRGSGMFITAPVTTTTQAFHDEAAGFASMHHHLHAHHGPHLHPHHDTLPASTTPAGFLGSSQSESFFDPHAPAPFLTPEPAVDPFLAQDAPMLHMACMTAFPHEFTAVAAGPSLSAALAFNAPRSSSFPATPLVSGPPPNPDRHAHEHAHDDFPVSLACCPVAPSSSSSSEHAHMHVHVPPPPAPPSPWMVRGDATVTLPLTAPMTPVTPTTPTAALLSPTSANATAWTAAVRAAEQAYHTELERQLRRHNLGVRVGALPAGVAGAVLATVPDAAEDGDMLPRDQASMRPAVKPDPDHDLAKTLTAAEHAKQQLHGLPVPPAAAGWPLHFAPRRHPRARSRRASQKRAGKLPACSSVAAAADAATTPLIPTSRSAPVTDFICPVCQKRFVRSFKPQSRT